MNRSTITVAADGSCMVETVREQDGQTWHVRYPAWAWRDAAGNTVIDGRNQPVEEIAIPPGSGWIPDSFQIKPDGTTISEDDFHQGGPGVTAIPGAG